LIQMDEELTKINEAELCFTSEIGEKFNIKKEEIWLLLIRISLQ